MNSPLTLLSGLLACLPSTTKPFLALVATLARDPVWIWLLSRRSRPRGFYWTVCDRWHCKKLTVHTNKIRLHWIELKQTLEEVIYWWDAACKRVLLDSITMCCNGRWIGGRSENCHSWRCGWLLAGSHGFRRQNGFRNGLLPKINEEPLPWVIESLWYRLCRSTSAATPALKAAQQTTAE